MKVRTLVIAGLLAALCWSQATAQEPKAKAKAKGVPAAVAHKPSPIPDRIILTWTGDPVHTQSVNWRTDTTVTKAVAQIAPTGAGPKFVDKARTVEATTTPLKADLGEAHCHSVTFKDLEPNSKYLYRVGDGANWSEWIQFRTASAKPEPFSFIYFGDAQNDIKSHWSRVIRGAYSDMPQARFIVHAGDLVDVPNSDAQWGEWFYAGGWVNAMVPTVPTPGNHEYTSVRVEEQGQTVSRPALSGHWRPQFALPENGPAGMEELKETCYYLDYQGVRIVSLDSNLKQREQVPWLEKVLSDNPNRWTVLTFHHPIHSSAKGRDNPRVRNAWQPIFDKYRVDLVLTGHDHTYARSGLLTFQGENVAEGARVRDPKAGTVYVVSVSGPKQYELEVEPWMVSSAQQTQLYQLITINGDKLRYEARTATGDRYDMFELRKRTGEPNELLERAELEKAENGELAWEYRWGAVGIVVMVGGLVLLRRWVG
jgi:3',5'-cyclic AMP phosphodiesterase CpdA